MNREIKLRVWDKEDKKFLKPCFEPEEDRFNKGMAMIHWNSEGKIWFTLSGYRDDDGNPYQIDAETMQYTGFKDKNGKEIYEGDIVNCKEYECYGKITWDEDCAVFRFEILQEDGTFIDDWLCDYVCELEVIGNIYENPELLEVQQ